MDVKHGFGRIRGARLVGLVLAGIVTVVVLAFVFGYLVMLLWNWLMPGVFGVRQISYWEAAGIVLLARLLFGSAGGPAGRHRGKKGHAFRRHRLPYWERYDEWWKAEGQASFQSYVERVDAEGKKQP